MHVFVGASNGGASLEPKEAMAPLALQILHKMNSDFDTIHYCSKRMAPLILLRSEIKLRQWPPPLASGHCAPGGLERGLRRSAACLHGVSNGFHLRQVHGLLGDILVAGDS